MSWLSTWTRRPRRVAGPLAFALTMLVSASMAEDETSDFDRGYVGVSGTMLLPQGGQRLDRQRGGAEARLGWYVTETLAVEADAAWLEDLAGLAVRGLWHWRGCDEYDKLFGFSRFDPFFTLGAKGWLDRGNVGPSGGLGALWYLDDRWALRFDADATLGVETDVAMCYTVGVGVQASF